MAPDPALDPTIPESSATTVPASETPLETLASTARLVVLWVFVTTFLFQNYLIPSGSM